jgi:hypothetical protein
MFPWDHVDFQKDHVKFNDPHKETILPVLKLKGSLPILNEIRTEFFERLFNKKVVKLYFRDNAFDLSISSDWQKLCDLIEPAVQFAHFQVDAAAGKKKVLKFSLLSNENIMQVWHIHFSKSQFLQHLATRHHDEFRIIPVLEYQNKVREESFIFRVLKQAELLADYWVRV